jgi:hypothetical protein
MEAKFSQLTLDVIGRAVFNYDFDALNRQSPVIQVGALLKCRRAGAVGGTRTRAVLCCSSSSSS